MSRPDQAEVTDLYQIDSLLSEDERAVRETVARFIDTSYLPIAGKLFTEGRFPTELIPELASLGVLGATLRGYGCAGLSNVAGGLIYQELERGDSGMRSFASVQTALCMFPIWAYGSDAQKVRYLPKMAEGRVIGCFGLTEPNAGSDPAGMTTRARRDGNDYVLDGAKAWITNATIADLALVWAKVDGGGTESIAGFLVDRGTPGFAATEIEGKWSLRASRTGDLSLQSVRVPASQMLPGVRGLRGPLSCLNKARSGIAAGVMGAAVACFEGARAYAAERKMFGKSLAHFQLTQEKLADMLQEIVKGQLLVLQLGRLADAKGSVSPAQVSLAKRNNVRAALEIARYARSIYGANGITDAYPPLRHLLNLESVFTYEGTHEMHTLIVGKAITGIDAFGGSKS